MPSRSLATVALAATAIFSAPFVAAAEAPAPTITPAPVHPDILPRQASSSATTYETTSPLPLTEYFYPYSAVPYQVNPYPVGRGPQSGYNQCNTSSADAQCQTLIFNSIFDFCFWGAPGLTPNQTIGDVEAAVVAYCNTDAHGSRIFPEGTFSSIQFMRTPAYIQIVGFFNQTSVMLNPTDTGGELDPHGADYLGNPLGGLAYSTGFSSGDNKTYVQTQSWNLFVGSNQFCLKFCDPGYSTDANYCQNIFDLIGCDYNMPADYSMLQSSSVFMSCDGDIQSEVGTYTSDGQTYTWSQPSSLPATSTLPWTPYVPASSNCVTYQSSDLFPVASLGYQSANFEFTTFGSATASGSASATASASRSGSSAASGSKATAASASKSGSANAVTTASASSKASSAAPLIGSASAIVAIVAAGIATIIMA